MAPHKILFGLAPNAHSLMAGSPVNAVRRRMKVASILYDEVLVESGQYRMTGGPGGAMSFKEDPPERLRWQTSRERGAVQGRQAGIGIGRETVPGVPAASIFPAMSTRITASWRATFEPFSPEIPDNCDWIQWVQMTRNVPVPLQNAAVAWSDADDRSGVLSGSFADHFVRNRVITTTNDTLVLAAGEGLAVSADPLHCEILAGRLKEGSDWQLTGFALPILVPDADTLTWDQVRDFRGDRHVRYLRQALGEMEEEALDAATPQGDLERTVHRICEQRLAQTNERTNNLGATINRTARGLLVAVGAGYATSAVTGPEGLLLSAGVGVAAGAVVDAAVATRSRRARAWVGAYFRLQDAATAT